MLNRKERTKLTLATLEPRTAPAIVVTTGADFNPDTYNPNIFGTYIVGSLRWAIYEAEAKPGPITFNTDPNLGVDFSDPANAKIQLTFGALQVRGGISIAGPAIQGDPTARLEIHRKTGLTSDLANPETREAVHWSTTPMRRVAARPGSLADFSLCSFHLAL